MIFFRKFYMNSGISLVISLHHSATLHWVQYAYLFLPAVQASACQAECPDLARRHNITSVEG